MEHDINSLARDVVAKFFADKTPLNDSISAIAKERALNEHMTRRLCEQANTDTRLQFYKQPGINQAAALFEPADSTKIIIVKEPERDMSADYIFPPQLATGNAVEITIKTASIEKAASERMQKRLKFDIEEKRASVTLRYSDFVGARNAFLKEAKNFLREDHDAKDLNKMASFIDGQETLRSIFPHLQKYMNDLGMQKMAMEIEELMNEKLPVTYVIGTHPLVMKYKGCIFQGDRLKNAIVELERAENIIEKKAFVGATLKALNPIRWAMANKGTAALMVGLPVGMAAYGAHQSSGQQAQMHDQMKAEVPFMSSYDNPEPQTPKRGNEYENDMREKGLIEANMSRMDESMRLAKVNRVDGRTGAGSSIPSRGLYDQARVDAKKGS